MIIPNNTPTELSWPKPKIIARALIGIGLVFLVRLPIEGRFFDPWFDNIFISLSPEFIGIGITVLLIDAASEYNKSQQWARVRALTYQTLAKHIVNSVVEMFSFPVNAPDLH